MVAADFDSKSVSPVLVIVTAKKKEKKNGVKNCKITSKKRVWKQSSTMLVLDVAGMLIRR